MAELANKTALGGVVGDTFQGLEVASVYADGRYGFVTAAPSAAAAISESVADLASRTVGAQEGFESTVATNGITYVVRGGAYVAEDLEIEVADLAARDALTELETGQRIYVTAQRRQDDWDGVAFIEGPVKPIIVALYSEIPDPFTLIVGVTYKVTGDGARNGMYMAAGDAPGSQALEITPV